MKKIKIITVCAAMALMSVFALVGCSGRNVEVLFDGNGGTPDKTSIVAVGGSSLPAVPAPTREGYTFTGWYVSSDCNEGDKWQTHYKVEGGMTLYAGWEKDGYISVNFDTLSGGDSVQNAPQDLNLKSGSLVLEPQTPTRDGYVFKNWYKDEGLTEPFDFSKDTVSADAVLYAKWTKIHTVSVKLSDGITKEYKMEDGKTIEQIPVPAVKDKMFIGYYDDAAFSKKAEFFQKITSDMTLYAKTVVPTDTSLYNIRWEKANDNPETDYGFAYISTKTHLDELVLPSEIDGKRITLYIFEDGIGKDEELYLDVDTIIFPSGTFTSSINNINHIRSKVKNIEVEYSSDPYSVSYEGYLYRKFEEWENYKIKYSTYILTIIPIGKKQDKVINIIPNGTIVESDGTHIFRLQTAPNEYMLDNGIQINNKTTFIVPDEYLEQYKNTEKLQTEYLEFISESEYAASIADNNGGSL